jgi:glycosyltransferase involved in cell wall biosynthesis
MSGEPRVSIVIPTYNRAALVCETLESAFAQTYGDFEAIVVDDGSTDGTREALGKYNDSRLRYFHQQNAGISAARNHALKQARGEYIAFLDSDDIWEPYKLDLMVRLLDRFPGVRFAFSDFSIMREGSPLQSGGLSTWHHPTRRWEDVFTEAHDFAALGVPSPAGLPTESFRVYVGEIYGPSLAEPWVLPSAALVRRSALSVVAELPDASVTCSDWEFFALLSRNANALFVALDTTRNRSHQDAVRLTRQRPATRLARRVRMIDRLWGSDEKFLASNRSRVEEVLYGILLKLAKLQLLDGETAEARRTLSRADRLSRGGDRSTRMAWRAIVTVPGLSAMLRAARAVRRYALP